MLENFKNSFEASSLKVKIELYLLPILIIFLLYILFYEEKVLENKSIKNNELLNIENRKFGGSVLELSSLIEELAKNDNLSLQKTKSDKESITLKVRGKREDFLSFLEKVELINNFTKVDFLSLKKIENENYLIDLKIDISKYYLKNKVEKLKDEIKIEVLEQDEIKDEEELIKPDFTINAIVGSNAFINGNWLELNDTILEYTLHFIGNDYVLLKKSSDTIKLEVNKIEYFETKNWLYFIWKIW